MFASNALLLNGSGTGCKHASTDPPAMSTFDQSRKRSEDSVNTSKLRRNSFFDTAVISPPAFFFSSGRVNTFGSAFSMSVGATHLNML